MYMTFSLFFLGLFFERAMHLQYIGEFNEIEWQLLVDIVFIIKLRPTSSIKCFLVKATHWKIDIRDPGVSWSLSKFHGDYIRLSNLLICCFICTAVLFVSLKTVYKLKLRAQPFQNLFPLMNRHPFLYIT